MRTTKKSASIAAPLMMGLGAVVVMASAAWAGADDGGSKAFYTTPGPGAAYTQQAPATSSGATRSFGQDDRATARVNDESFEGYRSVPRHHRVHVKHSTGN